jgi:hypothetical protein
MLPAVPNSVMRSLEAWFRCPSSTKLHVPFWADAGCPQDERRWRRDSISPARYFFRPAIHFPASYFKRLLLRGSRFFSAQ